MKAAFALVSLFFCARPALAADAFGARDESPMRGEIDADAARGEGDGAYGRFDGDLDVGFAAGANVALTSRGVGAGARVNALYYFTGGLYTSYGEMLTGSRDPMRRAAFGLELRPLFLPRWALDLQRGPAFWDLTLDSLNLGVGGFAASPRGGAFGERRGVEFSAGFGVPLFAEGPGAWLEARALIDLPNDGPSEALLMLSFAYHFAVLTPFVGR
jgi:hypothetical protein